MKERAIVAALAIGIAVLVVGAWVNERLYPTPVQLPKLGEPMDPHAPPPPTRYETLTIGMTASAVIASRWWGQPKSVNKTITSGHSREQWVYDRGYLYFDDGRLTAIQVNER